MVSQLHADLGKAMGVVEAAHLDTADINTWMKELNDSLTPLVGPAVTAVALLVECRPDAPHLTSFVASEQLSSLVAAFPMPDLGSLQRMAARSFVATRRTVDRAAPSFIDEDFKGRFSEATHTGDGLGITARVDEHLLCLMVPSTETLHFSKPEMRRLIRLALHVEAGLRLRVHPRQERLIVDASGKLLHKSGDSSAEVDEALRTHVRTVDKARTRAERGSPEALSAWTALVQGRFGLVERTESDGRRHYVLVETETRPGLVLSNAERRVVELAARGLSSKLVAYGQGVSEASVSQALARAAFKLGCRDRNELLRVASAFVPGSGESLPASLTEAEEQVLDLVRQGRGNAEIAQARGSSVRTVANQVAALLRKTGLPSRRALQVASQS